MTTLPDLKSEVAAFLQKAPGDFVVNGIDLLLRAINKVHQYAQMQHDFELMRCSVDVSINPQSGANFSPAHLHGTSNYVTVKKIRRVYLTGNNQGLFPIAYFNRDVESADIALEWHDWEFSQARLYPSWLSCAPPAVVQSGTKLHLYGGDQKLYGTEDVDIVADVYRYFPDYSTDEDNDFLLQFGDEYLLYGAICRLNLYSKEFVNRQEGNVSPPTQERDEAWNDLLSWDGSLILSGDTSVTLD